MSLWTQIWGLLAGPGPTSLELDTQFRESAGVNVDPDDDQWRRLSGDSIRDLAPMTQDRMQKLAHHVWEGNLLGNRLIELPLAYLLAKGVTLRVDDDDLQKVLNRHWKDGINAWPIKLPKKVRELALFGEQCWPVFVGPKGFVRIGYLDPSRIATAVTDPDNIEQTIGIVTKSDSHGRVRRYRVIVNAPEDVFTERTQKIRATFTDGDCFYFKVNDLCSSTRGRSDLLAQLDWLDAYDEYLFGELDRAGFLRAFIWDVTLKGATPDEVATRAKTIQPPKAGSVRVHNDAEEWATETPQLQAYEAAAAAKLFRNHVLGGATLPPTWYADGEDANRANGQSMAEPTEKMLEMRQSTVGYILAQVGMYVIRAKWGILEKEASDAQLEILDSVRCEWPEMTAKDTTKYAAALQQVIAAAVAAINSKLLTRETAMRIIGQLAAQLGIEIDVDAELKAVDQAAKVREKEDSFVPGNLPTDDGAGAGAGGDQNEEEEAEA